MCISVFFLSKCEKENIGGVKNFINYIFVQNLCKIKKDV